MRSGVPDCDVGWIVSRVRTALGGSMAPFPNMRFSQEVDPDGMISRRTMRYTVHHLGTGPTHVTATPPDLDGTPARLDVSAA